MVSPANVQKHLKSARLKLSAKTLSLDLTYCTKMRMLFSIPKRSIK